MNNLKRRRRAWGAETQEQEYWLSYSDLMAGLLMMFALMLVAALHHYGGIIEEAGGVASKRSDIIATLDSILRADSSGVTVDPVTGAVTFPDGVLFAEGRADLQPAGRAQLDGFADKYFGYLLGVDSIRREIRAIVIEGHTNDNAGYMYNLDLSQRRAFAVMQYLINTGAPQYNRELKQYVTASGRSYSQPVCTNLQVHSHPCPQGTAVDKARSRRIEILFRLQDEKTLEHVRELLRVR